MDEIVLLLGDPGLRVTCNPVEHITDTDFIEESNQLKNRLDNFRKKKGFGRGIAAPQIGVPKRFIALNIGKGTQTLINPKITWHSLETFTLWDDCMSFPDLLIKVNRYQSISISFYDENGIFQEWNHLDKMESELLQHELDHLDGVLAIDRAVNSEGLIYRAVYEQSREYFNKQVDYVIQPTI